MDKIIIQGGQPLNGTVPIGGSKNAVLPIITAALLVDGITTIRRVPRLRDTHTMVRLLEMIGAGMEFEGHKLTIDAGSANRPEAPYSLVRTMRASFYVLGPLLARFGRARVSLPGGCAWGPRPVNYHLTGLERLGVRIELEGGYIVARAKRLQGNQISFEIPSVGATGNILMAAVLARGQTEIQNAAREPEIVQLCQVLNSMGARIEGVGTRRLIIEGVDNLEGREVAVIADRIEAGTFLIAGAALGKITLQDSQPQHLTALIEKLQLAGARVETAEGEISVERPAVLEAVDVSTAVYPGFPTDLQAQWIALMSLARGSSVITDTIYLDRFKHVPELNRLGADIKLERNRALVRGQDQLVGAPVMSTDIRASAALVLGGLMASGRTEISRVYHLDRGYEQIEEKFKHLGARIWRQSE